MKIQPDTYIDQIESNLCLLQPKYLFELFPPPHLLPLILSAPAVLKIQLHPWKAMDLDSVTLLMTFRFKTGSQVTPAPQVSS